VLNTRPRRMRYFSNPTMTGSLLNEMVDSIAGAWSKARQTLKLQSLL
jgi:hypothetical protein